MNELLDILKYVVPSIVVFATSYYLLRLFINNDQLRRNSEIKLQNQNIITPIRLQSYERLVMFLERISPNSLIMRNHRSDMTATQLQFVLIQTIRDEFEHNLSQQVYISQQAWDIVKAAKEDIIKLINTAAGSISENATAMQYSEKIIEMSLSKERLATNVALEFLKKEISKSF